MQPASANNGMEGICAAVIVYLILHPVEHHQCFKVFGHRNGHKRKKPDGFHHRAFRYLFETLRVSFSSGDRI